MAVPDDFFGELYNGKLIERNRAIRYSHETRHPLQVQYDREHGIRGNLAPGVTCGRRVDHLTPEEREFADYYEIGFEHLQQPQGQQVVAVAETDNAVKGGCGFGKLFRWVRSVFARNH